MTSAMLLTEASIGERLETHGSPFDILQSRIIGGELGAVEVFASWQLDMHIRHNSHLHLNLLCAQFQDMATGFSII